MLRRLPGLVEESNSYKAGQSMQLDTGDQGLAGLRQSTYIDGESATEIPGAGHVAEPALLSLHPDLQDDKPALDTDISVVIPTYNAGQEFYWLLRKLHAQKGLKQIQIVIVDSGSSDGTVRLAKQANCTVIEISQSEFSHSYARNLGADHATGEYLLFMVQDAYPIGDYWMYGVIRYLIDHKEQNLVAASCAEYCRLDSDIMYDCNVNTHYEFLMCNDRDRIGEYRGDGHETLRAYGQLSDVSCFMARDVFNEYRYQGDYAEDLDLGIRLIKDGYRIAMLASIKVIHSHNRPAIYYLKRSFVDVIFLVRQFDDFEFPQTGSVRGMFIGIVNLSCHLTELVHNFDLEYTDINLEKLLRDLLRKLRRTVRRVRLDGKIDLLDDQLNSQIKEYREQYVIPGGKISGQEKTEALAFFAGFVGRLEHFRAFASDIYLQQDKALKLEVLDMIIKTFSATVGSYLGFLYLENVHLNNEPAAIVERIKSELQAGI
jgi:glycosyltransferase involved in cell wall biosynthesis